MRSKQSIGFTSVFGFNTEASGTLFALPWAVQNNSWKESSAPPEHFVEHVNIGIIGPSFLQVLPYFLIPNRLSMQVELP